MDTDTALDQDAAPASDKLREVHKRAIARFDDTVLPQLEMRGEALMARRFVSILGAMWEGPWGEQFENSIKVEIPKVKNGIRKIENDYRQNRIVPDFRPSGGASDQDTADTLDGLHRADSNHFKSQQARDNAFSEACRGGFGAYRLTNEWADPYDKDSDEQRINPALTIVDADQTVFFDGNSKLYDKSDARFAFVITSMTVDAFKEEYGEDKLVTWPETGHRSGYDWYTADVTRVCEYYEVEDSTESLLVMTFPLTGEEQRLWEKDTDRADREAQGWEITTRRMKRRRVRKYTMTGAQVVRDHGRIAGTCIPIVPVYGAREYVDGQERFQGHVQSKMDAQRLYNAKVSKLAETDALSPREKPIFASQQMPPNLAVMWQRQEIDRHPYALVEPLIDETTGQIVSAGPIGKVEPPQLSPVTGALLEIANRDLVEDDEDGADQVKANTSAEAMDIAATRIDAKSGIYLDNMRQSVQREGEIYLSMAAEVYVEDGRVVETMDEDGGDGEAVLNEPYRDSKGVHKTRNNFSEGKYKVVVEVTEATATRRDKTVRAALNTASVATEAQDLELAQVSLLTAVMNQDGEGSSDLQKYARKRLVGMGVVEPNDEEKAQMQAEAEAAAAQPDPNAVLAQAQAQALQAGAAKDMAQAQESESKIELNEAKTVETLAKAGKARTEALRPANDTQQPQKRIAFGYER